MDQMDKRSRFNASLFDSKMYWSFILKFIYTLQPLQRSSAPMNMSGACTPTANRQVPGGWIRSTMMRKNSVAEVAPTCLPFHVHRPNFSGLGDPRVLPYQQGYLARRSFCITKLTTSMQKPTKNTSSLRSMPSRYCHGTAVAKVESRVPKALLLSHALEREQNAPIPAFW